MNYYVPVEGQDGLYRDTRTGAIINKNHLEFKSDMKQREKLNSEKERIDSIQNEVLSLKNDVTDIKSMLHNITNILNPKS